MRRAVRRDFGESSDSFRRVYARSRESRICLHEALDFGDAMRNSEKLRKVFEEFSKSFREISRLNFLLDEALDFGDAARSSERLRRIFGEYTRDPGNPGITCTRRKILQMGRAARTYFGKPLQHKINHSRVTRRTVLRTITPCSMRSRDCLSTPSCVKNAAVADWSIGSCCVCVKM